MNTFHFIVQPKGGTGKTFVAYLLFQFLHENGCNVIGYDTDNLCYCFSEFHEFHVRKIKIANDGKTSAPITFAPVLDEMAQIGNCTHAVIDNAAATAPQFENYLRQNDTIAKIMANGDKVFFHIVIAGGGQINASVAHFARISDLYPDIPLYVWLNDYFGSIIMHDKTFLEFNAYQSRKNRIVGIVEIESQKNALIPPDIQDMLTKRLSFKAFLADPNNSIAVRGRMHKFWNDMKNRMDMANICMK